MEKNLAVFDFDHTLTTRDTLLELIKFLKGGPRFAWGMLLQSPYLLLYMGGLFPNQRAKEMVIRYFFGGMGLDLFNEKCRHFQESRLPKLIRREAFEKLLEHKKNGDRVVLVSASAENWTSSWCSRWGIECIGSRLEVNEGMLTGRLKGKNCYGSEKVIRLNESVQLSQYREISVYGDSRGDRELLALATRPFYRRFR